jgi:ribosomal protein L24
MKIPTFRKGDRVRVTVGADTGSHGEVIDTGDTWVQGQGQVVHVRLENPKRRGTYVGSSLEKLNASI